MDESGDLWFDLSKWRTTRFFIVTFLFTKHTWPLEKVIKKLFASMTDKERIRHNGVIHCHKEHVKVQRRLFSELQTKDFSVMSISLDKTLYPKMQNEKGVLYSSIVHKLLDRIISKKILGDYKKIVFVASQRDTNKMLNYNFCNYLEGNTKDTHKIDIQVQIQVPQNNKLLQVVDALSWAIYRKYEHGDMEFYTYISDKIIEEDSI